MEATESNLEIKLTQLRMNVEKTNSVIVSNNAEAIERHQQTLKTISANVNHMRLEVEAKKLEAKEEMTGIQTWNEDVDARLQEADIEIGKARKWMDERKREAEVNAKQEQLKFEEELQKMKLQLKTEQQAKKSQNEETHQSTSANNTQAKLPKLVLGSLRIDDFCTTTPLDCVTCLLRMPIWALAGVEPKSTTLVRAICRRLRNRRT